MKRLLPHPFMAGVLLVTWLLLAQAISPGTIALGIVLALGLSWTFGRLQPPPVHVRHAGKLLALLLRVAGDIVRSNIAVARIIVLRPRRISAGFVTIPLELRNPYGLAMLACIITATPGTIWVSHDPARAMLVIHVLDVIDKDIWISSIKQRYEQPLLEIFH